MAGIEKSMAQYVQEHPKLKYVFFGGKGGVGKTVMAGVSAMWFAKQGRRTMLASTNPVHSLSGLLSQLVSSFVADPATIQLKIDGGNIPLDVDQAITLGIVINELVSNSLKHAFPNRRGRIDVSVSGDRERLLLEVIDDGIGLPADVQLDTVRTLGLKIVTALTRQIHGVVEVVRDGGTRFLVSFPTVARLQEAA